MNCVKAANGSAKALLNLVVTEFPCFRDEALFAGSQGKVSLNFESNVVHVILIILFFFPFFPISIFSFLLQKSANSGRRCVGLF